MLKTVPNLLPVFVLLIAALACVAPGVVTPDPNFISTAIAQTHSVAASQTAQFLVPVTGRESATPTRAASATPFPTFTLVVLATPEVRVSVNTNCRTGPGNVYNVVGVLQPDEVAQVVGRSAGGNFWAIRNPDRPGEVCWITDENATITGFTNLVPVFTPPPTPTPTRTQIPVLPAPTRTRTPAPTSPPARTATQTSPPPLTPTASFTPTPTATSTDTSSLSPTPTDTSTPSQTPTATPTDLASLSPTPSSTATATSTDVSSLSPTPTDISTPSQTPTASSTSTPTPTGTSTPSQTPTPTSTSTPTPTVTGTLTPAFTASYSGMDNCPSLGWWLEFEVTNTGAAPFDFMALTVTDAATGTFRPLYTSDFTNRNGCATAITLDSFPPGVTHTLSSAPFTYDPTGHLLNARITLCADPGLNGICLSQTIDFTP